MIMISTRLMILTSMLLHLTTFIAVAIGSIYELKWLIFGSLITLSLGIFFGKETLERLDYEENLKKPKTAQRDSGFV